MSLPMQYNSAKHELLLPTSRVINNNTIHKSEGLAGSHQLEIQDPLVFAVASKRKYDDVISASRRQQRQQPVDNTDDDEHLLHSRDPTDTRALCAVSPYSEERDGPAEDSDDLLNDEETQALVKKFRTSVFRQRNEVESSPPSSFSSNSSLFEFPIAKEEDNIFDLLSIQRATTICDDSCQSTDNSDYDPPEISSRPNSPQEHDEKLDHQHDNWSSSYLSLECDHHEEKDPIHESRREYAPWPVSISSSSVGPYRPSPLWNSSSEKKGPWFQPGHQTVTFHQGSA